MLHLRAVFTKRDRTARLLNVANLLFQHPHGLTAPRIAELIGMNVRTVYRDLRALESEVGVPIWQDGNRYGADRTSLLPPLKLTLSRPLKPADPSYRELTRDAYARRMAAQGMRPEVIQAYMGTAHA